MVDAIGGRSSGTAATAAAAAAAVAARGVVVGGGVMAGGNSESSMMSSTSEWSPESLVLLPFLVAAATAAAVTGLAFTDEGRGRGGPAAEPRWIEMANNRRRYGMKGCMWGYTYGWGVPSCNQRKK